MSTYVDVHPGPPESTHDLSLEVGEEKYGLHVVGGIPAIHEQPASPSTIFKNPPKQKYGDFDPEWSHIQQSDWTNGRGTEEMDDDASAFYHGRYFWSLSPKRSSQAPLWAWAAGEYRDYNMFQPMDGSGVTFRPLLAGERYLASPFTVSALDSTSYDAVKAYVLLRRRGNPGTLTVEIWSDSSGPSAKVGSFTATTDTDTITDILSLWKAFEPASAETLTHDSTYYVVVYGASTDNEGNHWEIGCDMSTAGGYVSADGSSWSVKTFKPYFRVVDADVPVRWHFFNLVSDAGVNTYFKVSEPASGTSKLFKWDETNDKWVAQSLGGTALSNIVKGVVVMDNIAFFPRGSTEAIFSIYDNAGTWTGHDDNSEYADVLGVYVDKSSGPQIARYINGSTWAYAHGDVPAEGGNITFGTAVSGPSGFECLSMQFYNNQMWLRFTNGLSYVASDAIIPVDFGLEWITELASYEGPMLARDLYLFLGWAFAYERLYGGTLDDVGPHRGTGLPDGYQGVVSCNAADVAVTWVGVKAVSTKTSSVFATTEKGALYHPVWEAWETGQQVRNLYLQSQNGTTNPRRLWISVGGDSVYIPLPDNALNPLKDSDQQYVWEGSYQTGAVPIEHALPKIYKDLSVFARNLGEAGSVGVDYQLDDAVGSSDPSKWITATELYQSPKDVAELNLGNASNIRFRIRLMSKSNINPIELHAIVLKAVARTPLKRLWSMRIDVGRDQNDIGRPDHDPFELFTWLRVKAVGGYLLKLNSKDPLMHGVWVKVDNPTTMRESIGQDGTPKGKVQLVLREV